MHKRQWLRAVSMTSCLAWTLAAQEPAPAPSAEAKSGQVVKVPAHRSRWDYPKEITIPENTQLHIVERGDTFWDLGNKYLGNPFAWPQIWELNKWVTDPHWIYPVDHLLVPGGRQAVVQGETPAEVANVQPRRHMFNKPVQDEYAFTFQDFIQLPYLAAKGAQAHFKEIGAVKIVDRKASDRSLLADGDEVSLDGGSSKGLKVGDRLLVHKVVKTKLYAASDFQHQNNLGDVIKQVGVARILHTESNSAIGVIEKSMDAVEVGDHLAPFAEPANMLTRLRTDITEPVAIQSPAASVIYIGENRSVNGPGEMLIINKGTKDGLQVGQVLLAVRNHEWTVDRDDRGRDVKGKTTSYLGQLIVVKTEAASATCRVLRSLEEIVPNDIVTK